MKTSLRTIFYSSMLVTLAMVTSGCTGNDNPAPTVTEESSPQAEATETPTPVESIKYVIDDNAIKTLPVVEGVSDSDVKSAVISAKEFALDGIANPFFLSGEWRNHSSQEIANEFSESITQSITDVISGLDIADPEDNKTLASIAAVFSPDDVIKNKTECDNFSVWSDCLSSDIKFDTLAVVNDQGRIKVTFSVDTSRDLLLNEAPAISTIHYEYSTWLIFIDNAWKVDAFHNSYKFGTVTTK